MFRWLAASYVHGAEADPVDAVNHILTELRPSQLMEFLEQWWFKALDTTTLGITNDQKAKVREFARPAPFADPTVTVPADPIGWRHLSYAYFVEATRAHDIIERIISLLLTGESLPRPSAKTLAWCRNTEELFFKPYAPWSIASVTSSVRPSFPAVRRSAYYRLLGMDLPHSPDAETAKHVVKSDTANRAFSQVFESFLQEVWRAHVHKSNKVGVNSTDFGAIETHVKQLRDMLRARRHQGALAREEFATVAMAAWIHMSFEDNNQITNDLGARAGNSSDRLTTLGRLVGCPVHTKAYSFLELAEPMDRILRRIEATNHPDEDFGADYVDFYVRSPNVDNNSTASAYRPGLNLADDTLTVITHWGQARNVNLKALAHGV